jgi:replicative DNA helicase
MTEAINDSPLYLADQSISTIQQIRFLAIRMKRQYGIKLLVIDYLQLIGTQSHRSYNNSRELEIATITRGLKTLARELNIPIIIASQLSRAVETRTGDKRPILSDLRESGAIEQEADKVLLLYRGEYYGIEMDYDGQSTKDVAEVIVAKNRSGPVSTARLRFIARHARFENFDEFNSPDRYLDEDIEKRIKNKFKIFDRQSEDNLSIPF